MKRTRRSHRKGTRKATRRMRGGFIQMNPANVEDTNGGMDSSSKLNILQGQGYDAIHKDQHGGQATPPASGLFANTMKAAMAQAQEQTAPAQKGGEAPVGDTGVLDPALVQYARTGPLDASFAEIQGMKDQGGGARRRKRKSSKKSRKSKKKGRKGQRGGWAPVDSPTMMLPTDMQEGAVMAMNPEWKLAENPASFDPTPAK